MEILGGSGEGSATSHPTLSVASVALTEIRRTEVKVLDAVIRSRVTPIIKAAGFTRRGRLFSMASSVGDHAFVWFSPFRLGHRDAEFFVDVGVVPAIYAAFVSRDGHTAVTTNAGLWHTRLVVPGKGGLFGRDLWSSTPATTPRSSS